MTATAQAAEPGVDSLPARLIGRATEHPSRVALRHKDLGRWREYTWKEYLALVTRAGLGLRALGLERGDKVAVLSENRPEWLFLDLGAQGMGLVTVGVYPTSPVAEVEYLLEHSESVVAVAEDEEQLDKLLAIRDRLPKLRHIVVIEPRGTRQYLADPAVLSLEDLLARGADRDPAEYRAAVSALEPEDVAVLVYTSGTTGPPKGAMLSHKNLAVAGACFLQVLEVRPGDEALSYLPLCHVAERVFSGIAAVSVGYTVNFGGGGESLLSDLREVQPHFFFGVPRVWEKMLATVDIKMADASWLKRVTYRIWLRQGRRIARRRLSGAKLGPVDRALQAVGWALLFRPLRERLGLARVRVAGSGAAPIAPQVLEFFWAIGVPVREGYGQTEGTALATWTPSDGVRIGKVGKAVPGVELRIADDGEILVRSEGVFPGYFKNPEATRATVDDEGWLHTGDVGTLDEEGFLQITDRKKDIIITAGGKNVSPSWIENLLKVSPFVREAIVIGDRRKHLTALIGIELDTVGDWATRRRLAFTTYQDLSEKAEVVALVQGIVDQVNEQLAQVERVKKFKLLPKELDHEEGELTATQKVKRRAIATQFEPLVEEMYR
ncbi:MAG: long-chain fatty acid--CoA ligase [Gemmatimonadales bacterium]